MKKTFTTLFCLLLTISLFNSCSSTKSVATTITVESGEIPPDMKKEDFTLIGVLKDRNSRDKYTKSEFAKYTGSYVLANQSEINTKYSDVNKYRYVMDFRVEKGSPPEFYPIDRYYILDRKANKEYKRLDASGSFKKEMRAYLAAIEAVRKK